MDGVADMENFGKLCIKSAKVEMEVALIIAANKMIADQVMEPLKQCVHRVEVGGIWKGDGANRFVTEMNTEVIPSLVSISETLFAFGGQTSNSSNILTKAENTACEIIGEVTKVSLDILTFGLW